MGTEKSRSAHVLKGLFLRIYLYSSLLKNYVILQIMLLILILLSNERPHNFNTKPWYGSVRSQSMHWVCPGTGWTGFQSLFYGCYGDGCLAINIVALCDYVSLLSSWNLSLTSHASSEHTSWVSGSCFTLYWKVIFLHNCGCKTAS